MGDCMMRRVILAAALLSSMVLMSAASAGSGDWIKTRQDDSYHAVNQWNDAQSVDGPHATNPTGCQWTIDDEVTNWWSNGTLASGESVSFSECFMSDWVERVNQAQAYDRRGTPLQVTVAASNQYHSRTVTELGETCLVGPAYPHLSQADHTNPYAQHVAGSEIDLLHPSATPDDGGWAVGPTTITVTVTNTTGRTVREVGISSLVGRWYNWGPPQRPAACDGLPITPAVDFEPRWRS
jgi:hypothetical protein